MGAWTILERGRAEQAQTLSLLCTHTSYPTMPPSHFIIAP